MSPWWEVLRSCTLLGALNPGILRPPWLAEQGVIPGPEAEFRVQLGPHGGAAASFETSLYVWAVDSRRLIVNGASTDADPGEFVAVVMDKLQHTPVEAVGNNFQFESSPEIGGEVWRQCYQVQLPETIAKSLLSHEFIHKFEHNDAIVSLKQVVKDGAVRAIDFNFHRPVTTPETAAAAAREWPADRRVAKSLMVQLFGGKDA